MCMLSTGTFAIDSYTASSVERMREDCQRVQNLVFVENFLAERFSSLSSKAFQSNNQVMKEQRLPSFSQKRWLETPNALAFATNYFITEGGFRNGPHRDGDDTKYSMAWWALINYLTGEFYPLNLLEGVKC